MPDLAEISQNKPDLACFEPLPGEPGLWFRRFCLYRDLGAKRSLKLALARERLNIHLLKKHQKAPENENELSWPAEVVYVPGSWKQACKEAIRLYQRQ